MPSRILLFLIALLVFTACNRKSKKPRPVETTQETPAYPYPIDPSSANPYPPYISDPIPDDPPPRVVEQPFQQQPAPGSIADFQLNVGDRVFFAYDSYHLTQEARNVLTKQARWLNQHPHISIQISGNCDERGTREYNLALGAQRAKSAKDYLVSQGVSPQRITTISYGKEKPIHPNSNERAWSLNRNAHTELKTLSRYTG